ncbi:MAG: hypothetical protein MZV63_32980 [Marinilabiliales bacterium]|nr:hypothetical protein [Marinilabiliales bacterium]
MAALPSPQPAGLSVTGSRPVVRTLPSHRSWLKRLGQSYATGLLSSDPSPVQGYHGPTARPLQVGQTCAGPGPDSPQWRVSTGRRRNYPSWLNE